MVKLLAVGRMKAGPERDLYERYWTRFTPLAKTLGFGMPSVQEFKESSADSSDQRKRAEASMILGKVEPSAALLVFDERGKALTTPVFSSLLERLRDDGKSLVFAIGGPDGLDGSVRKRADMIISFGAMTMPHQIVRVVVAEQLYRAMTVLSGHPYHRD